MAARFHLDPLPWYGRRAPPAALREVAAAVWCDRRMRFTYESWKGAVRRTVAPLGLVMKAGDWYLVGVAGRSTRTYRVDAIRTLEVLDAFAPRTGFDLAQYWAQAARSFEERLASGSVRVRITDTGLRLLRDFNPRAWEAVVRQELVASADGWFETTIPFERGPQAVREVLRMGADMEVLEPAELRAAVVDEASRIAVLHGPGERQRSQISTIRRRRNALR